MTFGGPVQSSLGLHNSLGVWQLETVARGTRQGAEWQRGREAVRHFNDRAGNSASSLG